MPPMASPSPSVMPIRAASATSSLRPRQRRRACPQRRRAGVDAGPLARVALLLVLYALTGATSLAYQVCWSRFLALAFGGTLLTTSAVVACFLAGLALG